MHKYIDRDSADHKKLLALGYRKDPNTIALCVNRLRLGEKPYSLYGFHSNDRMVSQDLGIKIAKDYQDGKLDFISQFPADENERARHDPFRLTRYDIVKEAEEMAPHSLWNLGHLNGLGMSHDKAVELLQEYDRIRETRFEAEVTLESFLFEDDDGNPIALPLASPPTMAMRNFRDLPEYLRMLYSMYYETTYPDAPPLWVIRASVLRVGGKLSEVDRLVVSADNIFRYQVWKGQKNLESYFKGLARLSKTLSSHKKFLVELEKIFGIGGTN
jgi:hypothetical protein